MDRSALDLSAFRDFPSQDVGHAVPRLSINEKGRLSMNTAFRKAVGSARAFRGMYTEDGSRLLFLSDREPNIRFSPANATGRNRALADILKKLGYKFPVLYTMEESKADHAWVGTCQEIMPPPAPPASLKAKRKHRSAKGETA